VLKPLLDLGLRGHAGNVVQTFNYRLDALLLQGFLGQAAVGLYQTGVVLAELAWYLPNAVSSALLPHVAANQERPPTPLLVRHTLLLTALCSILLIAVVWPALALLRPVYVGAVAPMAILLLGVTALSVHKVLSGDLSGRGLPQYPSLTSALALVVTLIGNLLFIPRYGIIGAAMASSLAYCVQTVALIRVYQRIAQVGWWDLLVVKLDDLLIYRRLVLGNTGAQR
jgi:O-antigen/teichoic acid export membrane protein